MAEILQETTITEWTPYEYVDNTFIHEIKPPVSLTVGETYTVIWDGTKYVCKCEKWVKYPALGNGIRFSGDDTFEIGNGEPFFIVDFTKHSNSAKRCLEIDTDNDAPHTLAIYEGILEEAESLSFSKFLCSPNFPYLPKNLLGWKLAQKNGGE